MGDIFFKMFSIYTVDIHPSLLFVCIMLLATSILLSAWIIARSTNGKDIQGLKQKYPNDRKKLRDTDFYDVAVVGAGPAGSTTAFYLAKNGRNCVLLEKKKFPRDKYCGDAVCKTAIEILMDMGVYEELLREKKAKISENGGLCSPGGLSYIGNSKEYIGEVPAALACKRIHLDNAIAMAAKRAGADLKEECDVTAAAFDKKSGKWTISVNSAGRSLTFQSRVLVCADGATSKLATQLGLVTRLPDSTCSRAYVKAGTYRLNADGVIFYNTSFLPGYSALFRHADGDMNYCVYVVPGNPDVQQEHLPYWHDHLKESDPGIRDALGPHPDMERMKAASLRLGGEEVTYGKHVLVVGDAAGMIDPMTGEGIHHAMDGGKMAAEHLLKLIDVGNYDTKAMKLYQDVWMKKFGSDFKWSKKISQLQYKYPILLDAATAALQRRGDRFLARWADIMTGRVPKSHLLKPEYVWSIGFELIILLIKRVFKRKSSRATKNINNNNCQK